MKLLLKQYFIAILYVGIYKIIIHLANVWKTNLFIRVIVVA